jgi:hypothetical protein
MLPLDIEVLDVSNKRACARSEGVSTRFLGEFAELVPRTPNGACHAGRIPTAHGAAAYPGAGLFARQ